MSSLWFRLKGHVQGWPLSQPEADSAIHKCRAVRREPFMRTTTYSLEVVLVTNRHSCQTQTEMVRVLKTLFVIRFVVAQHRPILLLSCLRHQKPILAYWQASGCFSCGQTGCDRPLPNVSTPLAQRADRRATRHQCDRHDSAYRVGETANKCTKEVGCPVSIPGMDRSAFRRPSTDGHLLSKAYFPRSGR